MQIRSLYISYSSVGLIWSRVYMVMTFFENLEIVRTYMVSDLHGRLSTFQSANSRLHGQNVPQATKKLELC